MNKILVFTILLFLEASTTEAQLDWQAICPTKPPPVAPNSNLIPFLNQAQTDKEFKWIEYKTATKAGVERLAQNLNEYLGSPKENCNSCLYHVWYSLPTNALIWPWRPTLYNKLIYRTCNLDTTNSWWQCTLDNPFDATNPAQAQQALRYNTVIAHPVAWDSANGVNATWMIFIECFEDGLLVFHGVIPNHVTGSNLVRAKRALGNAYTQFGFDSGKVFNHDTSGCCFNN